MRHFAVAAIGRDRPGIVTAVTRSLLERELNVEDSQMTILRGHFTMMLIIAGEDSIDVPDLRASLDATARELGLEAVSLSEVTDVEVGPATEPTHIVTVYGADHPGIVHAVAAALSDCGVNITDLNTRLVGEDETDDLYAMMLEIALPEGVSVGGLEALLEATKREQGVEITIRELDQDAL
jgi:glycine cleavage system transcriptional repressor